MSRRALACLLLTLTLGALSTATARADGDPASDILYFLDVFVTYSKPSPDVAAALTGEVAKARTGGYEIKVAVIATPQDLGAVPSLFNQPSVYARFLGAELASFFTGRLLVVMPAGFGIYHNGAATTAEEEALKRVTIGGPDPDSLVRAATAAVQALVDSANAPPPARDTTAPKVKALPASGHLGAKTELRYTVSDQSGKSKETVRVYGPSLALYATIATKLTAARPGTIRAVTWRIPKKMKRTGLKFCVLARDPSGNQSRPACAPIRVR